MDSHLALLINQEFKTSYTTDQAKFAIESDPQIALALLNRCWPKRQPMSQPNADVPIPQWHELKWKKRSDDPDFDLTWPIANHSVQPASVHQSPQTLKYDENFVFRAMDRQFSRLRDLVKDDETGEWARLSDLDTSQGSIALLHPSKLTPLRTLIVARMTEGATLPPLYRGQLVRVVDTPNDRWTLVSGVAYKPSRPRDFPFDGVLSLAVISLRKRLSASCLSKLSTLLKKAGVNACVILSDKVNEVEPLLKLVPDSFAVCDCCLSKKPVNSHELFLRLKIGDGNVPCLFSSLGLEGVTNDRAADADKVLAEILAQRHLLPAAWQTDFASSVPPERLSEGEIVPCDDVVIVTRGPPSSDAQQIVGRYFGHALVRLPPMHVALIKLKGRAGEGRVPLLHTRVSVAVADLLA